MQQRLAKAVAKGTEDGASSRASSSQQGSRSASPAPADLEDERSKISDNADVLKDQGNAIAQNVPNEKKGHESPAIGNSSNKNVGASDTSNILKSTPSGSTPAKPEDTSVRKSVEFSVEANQENQDSEIIATSSPSYDAREVDRMRKAHEEDSKARQEEIHAHMERIDALQAKLLYLTKSAAETAQRAASQAPGGTLEKKLAQKEEQIALLMEEGQKLSKSEMKHLSAIKRLQARAAEDEKATADLKKRLANAEVAAANAITSVRRAQEAEKQVIEKVKRLDRLEREVQNLKDDLDKSKSATESLQKQLMEANKRLEATEKKARSNATESERKNIADLRDEIADLRIEKKLAEDRAKAEMRDVKAEHTRQRDRANLLENELRNEISVRQYVQHLHLCY